MLNRNKIIYYWHELHILEKFLYKSSRGEAKHTVSQEVRNLRVQANVIKCIWKLLLYPGKNMKAF